MSRSPRHDVPFVLGRFVIEVVVVSDTNINIAKEAVESAKGVVTGHVHVVAPPLLGLGAVRGRVEGTPVRGIGHLGVALFFFITSAAFDFVDVAIGKVTLVEEGAVGMFHGKVEAPEVSLILAGTAGFGGGIDDPEGKVVGSRTWQSGHAIESHCRCLVESGHAAVDSAPGA